MQCKICKGEVVASFARPKGDGARLIEAKLYSDDYTRQYYQCTHCGLLYHTAFDGMDGKHYDLMTSRPKNGVGDGVEPTLNRAVREINIAAKLFQLHDIPLNQARVLVFGCGSGASLNLFLQHNVDAWGTDMMLSIRRDAPFPEESVYSSKLVPAMLERFIPLGEIEGQQFDVITMTEVFEHFTDPFKEIESIVKCLKSGGILYGTTGMADRVQGSYGDWKYLKALTHTMFLTRKAFAIMCAKLGVLGHIYPRSTELIGQTGMSKEQGVFVIQKP